MDDAYEYSEIATTDGNMIRSSYKVEVEVFHKNIARVKTQKASFPIKILQN